MTASGTGWIVDQRCGCDVGVAPSPCDRLDAMRQRTPNGRGRIALRSLPNSTCGPTLSGCTVFRLGGQHHDKSHQVSACRVSPPRPGAAVTLKIHSARITGPVTCLTEQGHEHKILIGRCMFENAGDDLIGNCWGAKGRNSTSLPIDAVKTALDSADQLLLD